MPIEILPGGDHSGRRNFLAGLAAGGMTLALGRRVGVGAETVEPWYALLSDLHIAANPAHRFLGQAPAENFRAAVADILSFETPPQGVLIDGDLSMKGGHPDDYRTLVNLLEPLRKARVPIHLALGNHDHRIHFRQVLREYAPDGARVVGKHASVVRGPGVRFVVLDSLDARDVSHGQLGGDQIAWLARRLDAHPDVPTVVLLHHNLQHRHNQRHHRHLPQPNRMALRDTDDLLGVLRPRRQVKAVVFGHTHNWHVREDEGLHWINLPAVGYALSHHAPLGWCRFTPGIDGGALELRCVGGDMRYHGHRSEIRWRA